MAGTDHGRVPLWRGGGSPRRARLITCPLNIPPNNHAAVGGMPASDTPEIPKHQQEMSREEKIL